MLVNYRMLRRGLNDVASSYGMRAFMTQVGDHYGRIAQSASRTPEEVFVTTRLNRRRWAATIVNDADNALAQEYGAGNMPRLAPLGRALDAARANDPNLKRRRK